MGRTARLEWFLGSALTLLAAQVGFAAWHDHSLHPLTHPRGRTVLCLYSLTAADRAPLLEVADQIGTTIMDLQAQPRLGRAPNGYERRFLGAFVEEAYPLRFVPAQIEPRCPPDR